MTRKIFKLLGWIILAIIVFVVLLIIWLTITEYKPNSVEDAVIETICDTSSPSPGDTLSVLSWNIGYAGLGKDSDFFMDGGKSVKSANKATVISNLNGISETAFAGKQLADIYMFQEVDTESSRSYSINEKEKLGIQNYSYALNYSCNFVPFPFPPIGKVNSGLLTVTNYSIETATRTSLPCPFTWPIRTANLKRCLLTSYIPLSNTDKYLVIVNLHLEAYDNGEGKIAQTNLLNEFIQREYSKGNYVIAGGDFNQEFPGAINSYPIKNKDLWCPGNLDERMLPDGWNYAYDISSPTCRLNNQPFDENDITNTQYYVIDGFILSPNITLESVNTLNEKFEYSDHNPVLMKITLSDDT